VKETHPESQSLHLRILIRFSIFGAVCVIFGCDFQIWRWESICNDFDSLIF
jgi:hypothetical protein